MELYIGIVIGGFMGSVISWCLFNIIHNSQVQQLSAKQKRKILSDTHTARYLLNGFGE